MEQIGDIEWIDPATITPYENNPNSHPDEQVAQIIASIKEFGFMSPVLIDERGMLLAGHGRRLAALELKLPAIPAVRRSGLTPEQKRAYVIADNKIAKNAGIDWDILSEQLRVLEAEGYNVAVTGFSESEVEQLLTKWAPASVDATKTADYANRSLLFNAEEWPTIKKGVDMVRESTGLKSESECLTLLCSQFE